MEKVREKFFKECVDNFEGELPKVNLTPHDMFEWIKRNPVKPLDICPHCEPRIKTNGFKTKLCSKCGWDYCE